MDYIIPKKLAKGDTIGVIAPSGVLKDMDAIYRAKEELENQGFNVVLGENIFSQDRYMSGTDEDRLADLHWAFLDEKIDTIICARGGYGALRLIDRIDYDLIRNNPKNFCGYSDITILSAMFLKCAGLVSYSSPMLNGDWGKGIEEYTQKSFFMALEGQVQELIAPIVHRKGFAEGISFGGNLASVVSLCGIDFIPDEGFIFFAEDLNEPVYKLDKMFKQLINIPKFRENIRGMALGKFLDTGYPEQMSQLFDEISEELNVPVISGLPISHEKVKATIPYGKKCRIDNAKFVI